VKLLPLNIASRFQRTSWLCPHGRCRQLRYLDRMGLRGTPYPARNRSLACTGGNTAFGVFIRTPDVAAIASRVEDLVIRPGGVLRHREWGLYEVGINGPDGAVVRIGWPSHLIKNE